MPLLPLVLGVVIALRWLAVLSCCKRLARLAELLLLLNLHSFPPMLACRARGRDQVDNTVGSWLLSHQRVRARAGSPL